MSVCQKKIAHGNGFHFHNCSKPVTSGDGKWCTIHDPVMRAVRAAKRGPTKFERDMQRGKAVRNVVDAAKKVVRSWATQNDSWEACQNAADANQELKTAVDALLAYEAMAK